MVLAAGHRSRRPRNSSRTQPLELLEAFETFFKIPPTATFAHGRSFRPDESLISMDRNSAAEVITDLHRLLYNTTPRGRNPPPVRAREVSQRILGCWTFPARFTFVVSPTGCRPSHSPEISAKAPPLPRRQRGKPPQPLSIGRFSDEPRISYNPLTNFYCFLLAERPEMREMSMS